MLKKALGSVDNFLNVITMYRLVMYCLIFLFAAAFYLCFLNVLPYSPWNLAFSVAFILLLCLLANSIFADVFLAPTNVESVYITALILALIIAPIKSFSSLPFLIWASILAMASKYIFAISKKHIFNPAAIAVAITAFAINQPANWWVGNIYLMPFVLVCGILITRKIKRTDLVLSFFASAAVFVIGYYFLKGSNILKTSETLLFYTPLLFFGFVMLTEPMTTPPTSGFRIAYGILTGFLFGPFIHVGTFYSTPELALLAGNIFAYVASPKEKLILTLKEKTKISPDIYDLVFEPDKKMKFKAGQYMEWTLAHEKPDNRGQRRYFTIASSPEKKEIRLGVKFYNNPSSFKKSLAQLKIGDKIVAGQLAGDFTLPKNKNQKLAFIAGGIGVTPFRSMAEHLLDTQEKRDIVLFYANKSKGDIVYKDVFNETQKKLGMKTVYIIGLLTEEIIKDQIPDYKERIFYISGPKAMIDSFKVALKKMGIKRSRIKTDFFPGFA